MSFRAHFHHLSDLLEGGVAIDWRKDRPYLLLLSGIILLTGPLSVFGCWIQAWNDRATPWEASEHWEGTREFAITFAVFDALLLIALVHFAPQLSAFWSRSLGSWLLSHLVIWYVFWTLLAPAFALAARRIDPRTRKARRVRLPSEQPPKPAAVEEPPAVQLARSKSGSGSTASSTAPKKRNKGRAVPLGTLLVQEREEQERRRTQITFVQAPRPSEDAQEARSPETPPPAPAPPPKAEKPERRKPEPLDKLF